MLGLVRVADFEQGLVEGVNAQFVIEAHLIHDISSYRMAHSQLLFRYHVGIINHDDVRVDVLFRVIDPPKVLHLQPLFGEYLEQFFVGKVLHLLVVWVVLSDKDDALFAGFVLLFVDQHHLDLRHLNPVPQARKRHPIKYVHSVLQLKIGVVAHLYLLVLVVDLFQLDLGKIVLVNLHQEFENLDLHE